MILVTTYRESKNELYVAGQIFGKRFVVNYKKNNNLLGLPGNLLETATFDKSIQGIVAQKEYLNKLEDILVNGSFDTAEFNTSKETLAYKRG